MSPAEERLAVEVARAAALPHLTHNVSGAAAGYPAKCEACGRLAPCDVELAYRAMP